MKDRVHQGTQRGRVAASVMACLLLLAAACGSDDNSGGSVPPPTSPRDSGEEASTDEGPGDESSDAVELSASYRIELTGEAGGRSFTRSGELYVAPTIEPTATTNGPNPIDVCVVSGFPAGTPEVGALWFASNSGCIPSAGPQDMDLAFVDVRDRGDSVRVDIEPDAGFTAQALNTYTSEDGLTALLFLIETGSMELTFSDNEVTGTIDFVGFCGLCTGGAGGNRGTYTATIEGIAG